VVCFASYRSALYLSIARLLETRWPVEGSCHLLDAQPTPPDSSTRTEMDKQPLGTLVVVRRKSAPVNSPKQNRLFWEGSTSSGWHDLSRVWMPVHSCQMLGIMLQCFVSWRGGNSPRLELRSVGYSCLVRQWPTLQKREIQALSMWAMLRNGRSFCKSKHSGAVAGRTCL